MFSERNMHIVARQSEFLWGRPDGQQCTARRATMRIFLSENITDPRKCEWHMQAFEYFLQKTLGIPENDIEEHQKCNRKHFPLENIRDSRKMALK